MVNLLARQHARFQGEGEPVRQTGGAGDLMALGGLAAKGQR